MAVKTIITEPNKLLRQISKPVESIGREEQQLMNDMLDTMYDANGIGLAAIQIGIPKRIINKNNKNADDKPAAAAEKAARIVRNDDAEFAVHPHYRRQ